MGHSKLPDRASPFIVVVAGLVASGKTTISRALATRLSAVRLEADRVRGTLLAATAAEASGAEARWRRDLSADFEDDVYADLLRRADAVLRKGQPLVLDACFPRRRQRAAVQALARQHGVPFLYVQCLVPLETIRARLADRDRALGREGWLEIFQRLADHFEPPDELSDTECMSVCSDGPTNPAIDAIVDRLRRRVRLPENPPPRIQPMPRVVSFDCWNTLIAEEDWPWAHSIRVAALSDAAREAGIAVEGDTAERAFDTAWRRHMELWEAGQVSGAREVAAWALAELGLPDPHPTLEHLVRRFEEASHTSRVVAVEGARPLLRALERTGVGRVLVCDTGLTPGRVVRHLLARVGLLESLEVLAFSDEVGAPKPDRRAFLAALDPLGVEPADVLHVGDLRRTDVAGARALGMRSVRIRAYHDDRTARPDADHLVESHAELAQLLGLRLESSDSASRQR